jgi:hypothetical protein
MGHPAGLPGRPGDRRDAEFQEGRWRGRIPGRERGRAAGQEGGRCRDRRHRPGCHAAGAGEAGRWVMSSSLTRVLTSRGQPGAPLADPARKLALVAVVRCEQVAPPASVLGKLRRDESPAPSSVDLMRYRFPVGRVLAGPVLASVAAWAGVVPGVAQMINFFVRTERPDKLAESEAVGSPARLSLPRVEAPVPTGDYATSPGPAVIRPLLAHECQVPIKRGDVAPQRATENAFAKQPQIVTVAQTFGARRPVTFAAFHHVLSVDAACLCAGEVVPHGV